MLLIPFQAFVLLLGTIIRKKDHASWLGINVENSFGKPRESPQEPRENAGEPRENLGEPTKDYFWESREDDIKKLQILCKSLWRPPPHTPPSHP